MTATTDHGPRYARLTEELTYRFEGVFSPRQVAAAVAAARMDLEQTANVGDHLPVLVERFARERLMATAQSQGKIAKEVPELLFVCIHNAGRSQMAAALAEHLAPGRIHVRTAGSRPADRVDAQVVAVLAEIGVDLGEAYPKPLSDDVVRAADAIVTMGCGDECPYYPGKRYEDWKVDDPAGQPLQVVRAIRDDIQRRVTALLNDLDR